MCVNTMPNAAAWKSEAESQTRDLQATNVNLCVIRVMKGLQSLLRVIADVYWVKFITASKRQGKKMWTAVKSWKYFQPGLVYVP